MVAVGTAVPERASTVFSPCPVTRATTRSSDRTTPWLTSLARVAMVTPPAVSAKMPSVRASSWIPSITSSSVTEAQEPPDLRMASSAYHPSAGLPMASDLAMVFGFTGRMASMPSAKAVATGEQPSAWAPETRTDGSSSSRPTFQSSSNPLATLVSWLPDPIGTTTWSGACHPNCSATSKARVFEPSA